MMREVKVTEEPRTSRAELRGGKKHNQPIYSNSTTTGASMTKQARYIYPIVVVPEWIPKGHDGRNTDVKLAWLLGIILGQEDAHEVAGKRDNDDRDVADVRTFVALAAHGYAACCLLHGD